MPSEVSEVKQAHSDRINRCIDQYDRLIFVTLDHCTSAQMHGVRRTILDGGLGEIFVGKKTTQKKILEVRANRKEATAADKVMWEIFVRENRLTGNLALCFTNNSVSELKAVFEKYRIQAPAKVGSISPVEVIIPAGNTGFEPNATSFFQALNISTKIAKGTVEIISEKKVLSPGDKVDMSTAALLQKLKISPFFYCPGIEMVWESPNLFTKEDLDVTDEAMEAAFTGTIANLTGLSLGSGVVTELSLPHAIADGFKNLLAAAVATDYNFSEYGCDKLIPDCRSGAAAPAGGGAAAAAAPAAAAAAAKKAEPEIVEDEEEEDDVGLGGLF